MLLVETDVGNFNWTLGDKVPMVNPHLIATITADGPELDIIRKEFGLSIPIARASSRAMWFGDMAATILFNLARIYIREQEPARVLPFNGAPAPTTTDSSIT